MTVQTFSPDTFLDGCSLPGIFTDTIFLGKIVLKKKTAFLENNVACYSTSSVVVAVVVVVVVVVVVAVVVACCFTLILETQEANYGLISANPCVPLFIISLYISRPQLNVSKQGLKTKGMVLHACAQATLCKSCQLAASQMILFWTLGHQLWPTASILASLMWLCWLSFSRILQLYGDQRSVTRAAFAMRSSSLQYTPGAPWQALCNRSGLQARASPDEEPSSLRTSAPVTRVRRHSGEENCVTTSHSGARRVVSKTSTTRLLATLYGWGWNAHGGIVGTAEAHRTGLGRWGSPRGRHASLHIVTRQQWKQTTPLATLKLLICEF